MRFRDEDGIRWVRILAAGDDTFAVETENDHPPRAGIATWQPDDSFAISVEPDGTIYTPAKTGAQWTVRDGEWVPSEA
jgi:hypothetical protein